MHHKTSDEIILLADQHIRRKGFNGFSYGHLAGIMDVKNAAIHYHFPSKADLGMSVIDKELYTVAKSRLDWMRLPANEQLKKIITIFYHRSTGEGVCLTGSLAAEYLTFADEMQQKVREMCQDYQEWVAAILEKGRQDKSLQFEGSPADRALLVLSVLMSSLLLNRILGHQTFGHMINQLLQDLRAGFGVADLEERPFPF